jgi:signal transduction histidine kinase
MVVLLRRIVFATNDADLPSAARRLNVGFSGAAYCARSRRGVLRLEVAGRAHGAYRRQMAADSRVWGWYQRHTMQVDLVPVAILLCAVLFTPGQSGRRSLLHGSVVVLCFAVASSLAVIGRSRWPVAALVLTVGAVAVVTATAHTIALFTVVLTLYTVALRTDRRVSILSWAATDLVLLGATLAQRHDHQLGGNILSFVAWTALAAAVGDAVRNRRDFVASIQERALRAEQSLDEEARRQVAEERLRIARELHDVVAHHMAVVTVQAGVASHLLATDPGATAESLDHIKRAGRAVLDELSGIMTVLRDPDDAAAITPAPGLSQVDDLLASLDAAGLRVMLTRHGQPARLGSAVDLVAFRVLQESLTNAHKHGTGTATAVITFSDAAVSLRVTNPTDRMDCSTRGHGILGMKERASAVNGQLSAAPGPAGVFVVDATLPIGVSDR